MYSEVFYHAVMHRDYERAMEFVPSALRVPMGCREFSLSAEAETRLPRLEAVKFWIFRRVLEDELGGRGVKSDHPVWVAYRKYQENGFWPELAAVIRQYSQEWVAENDAPLP